MLNKNNKNKKVILTLLSIFLFFSFNFVSASLRYDNPILPKLEEEITGGDTYIKK